MASPAPEPAPWRSAFLAHLDELSTPTFTLSTLHGASQSSPASSPSSPASSSAIQFAPRARTVVYRGMWASLPVNPKNTAELNPEDAYSSDLITITTDARMEKTTELLGDNAGREAPSASGRGGPVEALFWIEETNTQWRIRGHTFVVGPDIDSEAGKPVRDALRHYMRPSPSSSLEKGDFSFARELTAHFGNLSPGMRGSFRNPPPGTPLTKDPGEGLGLGQQVEDLHDEIARRHFRVVVIVPEEVDRVDLTDPKEGRRWNYRLVDGPDGTNKTWAVTELWP